MAKAIKDMVESALDYLQSVLDALEVDTRKAIELLASAPAGNVVHRVIAESGKSLADLVEARKARYSKVAIIATYLMTYDLPQVTTSTGKALTDKVDIARRIASVLVKSPDVVQGATLDTVMTHFNTEVKYKVARSTANLTRNDGQGVSAKQDAAVLGDIVTSIQRQLNNDASVEAVQAYIMPNLEALAAIFGKKLV